MLSRFKLIVLTLAFASFHFGNLAHAGNKVERAGDVLEVVIPLAAYSLTLVKGDNQGGREFLRSLSTTFLITHFLKNTVNAERPNGGIQSFPSGHTAMAFQGASFLHARYGLEAAWPAYAAATFVGYSRVAANKHHTRDVIAGAALGVATSFLFTRERFAPRKVHVLPFMNGTRAGFNFTVPLQ